MDSAGIVSLVSRLIAEGFDPVGICVLARNHYLLAKVSRMFDESNVPYSYIGRQTELVHSEPFIRYHAFLKLAINPMDNMAFLLIKDIIGLPRADYSGIRVLAAEEGLSHFQVWLRRAQGGLISLYDADLSLAETVSWLDTLYPELSPEASAFVYAWEKEHPDSIEDYLNWLALYEVQDEIKKDAKGISLQTIHSAKGLEWPVVILAGCNEGILPSKQSVSADDVEAERRLFYVAMTRAQNQCIMTVRPERTEKEGRIYESPVSRFVAEGGLE
ncbi:MAG: ATP-dependent helicase [Pseudomonadota bacterium]